MKKTIGKCINIVAILLGLVSTLAFFNAIGLCESFAITNGQFFVRILICGVGIIGAVLCSALGSTIAGEPFIVIEDDEEDDYEYYNTDVDYDFEID